MSGHTPGPWRAVDGRILPDNYVLLGAPIATVHVRKVDGMQESNVRLIAAAPMLLASLIEMRELFDLMCGLGFNPADGREGSPKANADAAIAKATQVHA